MIKIDRLLVKDYYSKIGRNNDARQELDLGIIPKDEIQLYLNSQTPNWELIQVVTLTIQAPIGDTAPPKIFGFDYYWKGR